MANKHPKERIIPKALLKAKALKSMENKVIMWVHVLELIVIVAAATVTVTTAFFFSFNRHFNFNINSLHNMSDKVIEIINPDTETSVNDRGVTVDAVKADDKKDDKELNVWPASR